LNSKRETGKYRAKVDLVWLIFGRKTTQFLVATGRNYEFLENLAEISSWDGRTFGRDELRISGGELQVRRYRNGAPEGAPFGSSCR
jgi:hypothetical protein